MVAFLYQDFCPPIAQNLGLSPGQALSCPRLASHPGLVLRSLNQVW